MAHALRYYKEIQQDNGQIIRLEIHKKDSTLPAVEIGRVLQALHLDIQGGADTIDAPIVKTSLTMTFVDAPDLEAGKKCGNWEEFYTPDSTMWMVVLKADGKTIWGGYVTPDSYQEDLRYRGSVTIIARDNIGHMQDFPFDMEGNAEGMVTLQELVNEAWAKIESPMRLDWWHEEQEAMYLMCEGNDAPSTYMNVSAFEDMNFFDAVEKALYSYGLVMRYTGSNRVTIMSLRDLPYQGKSSAPRAIEPTFLAHAQRELAPAVRRIEESVKYDIEESVALPRIKESDFTGSRSTYRCAIEGVDLGYGKFGTLEHEAPIWPIIDTPHWSNMPSTSLSFNPKIYPIGYFSEQQGLAEDIYQPMYLAANNVDQRLMLFKHLINCAAFNLRIKFTDPISLNSSYKIERCSTFNLKSIKYAIFVEQSGVAYYYGKDGSWRIDYQELTEEYDATQSSFDFVKTINMCEFSGSTEITFAILKIEYAQTSSGLNKYGLYAGIQLLAFEQSEGNAVLETNNVNTKYVDSNNVILTRDPEFGPAYNTVTLPQIIKNGIFVKSGNAYLPAKGWAWSGGTPQHMAVYNHLQLLCYHSKPNNVISGDIVNADFVDMEAIYEWGGANHLLVSGSFNFLNGRIESAVLREFKFYTDMWSDVSETSLPDTEQNNRTTAESGSGAAKASTYSNETTVNIGGSGGGGTGGSSTLAGLLDVQVSSPSNGQALVYDSASGMWMNKTIEKGDKVTSSAIISALGYTPLNADSFTKANLGLGNVDNIAAGDYFTELSSDATNAISATIGGMNKKITAAELKTSLGLGSLAYKSSLVVSDIPSLPWSKITSGKPTTLSGYGITDAILYERAIDLSSAYRSMGYGHASKGWRTSGPAVVFGDPSYNLAMQCAIENIDYVSLYLRMRYNGEDKGWDRVVTEGLLSRGAIAFDSTAYKCFGDIVIHRNSESGETFLNYGVANTDKADLRIFGYNINFYAGEASAYNTYLRLYAGGTAQFFVPLTIAANLTVTGDITVSGNSSSKNLPQGKALSQDPTSAFISTIFDADAVSDKSYRLRLLRNGSAMDRFAPAYAPILAFKTNDTHAFISVAYNTGGMSKCCIGGGTGDTIAWTGILFHDNMNLIPRWGDNYSLGDTTHRWKEVHAVSIKIGDATLTWDATAGMLKIDKGVYSEGAITAKKKA